MPDPGVDRELRNWGRAKVMHLEDRERAALLTALLEAEGMEVKHVLPDSWLYAPEGLTEAVTIYVPLQGEEPE